MKFNAYDLRKTSKYCYLRNTTEYIEEIETAMGDRNILVPSCMAGISLALQYYRPKSIWYPKDLYKETFELIEMLGISYNDVDPELVIFDYPSFPGIYYTNPFPNAIVIADNSVNPTMEPNNYDVLVTSLSKYHTDCKTILGTMKFSDLDVCNEIKMLRWKSGYLILKEQTDCVERKLLNMESFKKYYEVFQNKAILIGDYLKTKGVENVVSGTLVFIFIPDHIDSRTIALNTPFEVRGTYGAKVTVCTFSYREGHYRYFKNSFRMGKYIRICPGLDYSWQEIAEMTYQCCLQFLSP